MSLEHVNNDTTRRDFLKASATAAVAATALGIAPAVHAAGNDTIKVGVIGCGGRGSGAAEDVLRSTKGVEIVALGDYFQNKAIGLRKRLGDMVNEDEIKGLGNKATVTEDHCFGGLDAYKKVIDSGVDYVILATSPGFRPIHLKAAVEAGKNVFTEKPVAVDGPGIRSCLETYELALQKKVGIGAGTQRRHQAPYIETIKQIHDGAIGDIVAGRCYWNNTGSIWFRNRTPGMSDLDYQVHNWYHFVWLCGDHNVEQHVHNLDVINWATGQHPVSCVGMGGRVIPCNDPKVDGHIFNFFAVDYEYPNNVHILSQSRQIPNCEPGNVSEALVGTKGTCQVNAYIINGKRAVARGGRDRRDRNPYVQEHADLIESIRSGKPYNELKNVAESTLTAIMGRMSAYSGREVKWEEALNSKYSYMPDLTATELPVPPVAVPGKTRFS